MCGHTRMPDLERRPDRPGHDVHAPYRAIQLNRQGRAVLSLERSSTARIHREYGSSFGSDASASVLRLTMASRWILLDREISLESRGMKTSRMVLSVSRSSSDYQTGKLQVENGSKQRLRRPLAIPRSSSRNWNGIDEKRIVVRERRGWVRCASKGLRS